MLIITADMITIDAIVPTTRNDFISFLVSEIDLLLTLIVGVLFKNRLIKFIKGGTMNGIKAKAPSIIAERGNDNNNNTIENQTGGYPINLTLNIIDIIK